jgi:hypothetical protein
VDNIIFHCCGSPDHCFIAGGYKRQSAGYCNASWRNDLSLLNVASSLEKMGELCYHGRFILWYNFSDMGFYPYSCFSRLRKISQRGSNYGHYFLHLHSRNHIGYSGLNILGHKEEIIFDRSISLNGFLPHPCSNN